MVVDLAGPRGGCWRCAFWWVIAFAPALATARVETEAVTGEPFGVARITVPLTGEDAHVAWATEGLLLLERHGRALYPAFTGGRLRRTLGGAEPNHITVYFLFTGTEPLDVTLYAPDGRALALRPIRGRDGGLHRRLLQRWWREYNAIAQEQLDHGDYPPIVQTYATSMLARRLKLDPPGLKVEKEPNPAELEASFERLLGLESLRMAIMRRTSKGEYSAAESLDTPTPVDPPWQPPRPPPTAADVAIEPIALRIPHDCFYVRFGSFANYLWFTRLQNDYGGDISRLIALRGHDTQQMQRMERQLVLRQNALSEAFGPQVIADMAILGRDLYLDDGAAVGVLFQARVSALLGRDLQQQRSAACAQERTRGATLTTEAIAGREVSVLATPDNYLRSFYVVDGEYHLVTNSRGIVQRFLAVKDGRGSLGATGEFRHARTVFPISRQDTLFVHLSSAFLHGLLSVQYEIETARRLRAATDLALVRLAQWAARNEHKPADTIEDLIRADLLPMGFGRRPDGSGPAVQNGRLIDSLRGELGSFTPIPDVELRGVTRSELTGLVQNRASARAAFRPLDPIMIAVKRFALAQKDRERIVLDARISPFTPHQYGWLTSALGAPTRVRIRRAEGDVVSVQAAVRGGAWAPNVPPHHLFLGIQDTAPLNEVLPTGLLQTLLLLRATPGYLGAWPKPGFLDLLPLGLLGTKPDAHGYSRYPLGAWRLQWGDFSALSFDRELLARVAPQLAVEEAEDEAQLRVHIGDLSQARLQVWANSLAYARAYQVSLGNARLLHALSHQLGVPRDEAQHVAEELLNTKLVCSLGGTYRPTETASGLPVWTSTAWPGTLGRRPAEYRAPILEWFRGADAELTLYGDYAVLHGALDMQRKPAEPAPTLPLFELFGGGKAKDKPAAQPAVSPPAKKLQGPTEF